MKFKMKKRKGFTLVEMVLVITILGVLSSVAFMKFGGIQNKAEENADYIAASSLATAINLALNDKTIDTSQVSLELLKSEGYISSIPTPQSISNSKFEISVDKDSISIKVGDKIFYPKDKDIPSDKGIGSN